MKMPGKIQYYVPDPRSSWEGYWVYPTKKGSTEKEVVVVEPDALSSFIENKIVEGYNAGFRDALKTMPIVQKASNSWEFKE